MLRFSLLHKYNLFFTSILFLCFLVFNANLDFLPLSLSILGTISSAVILYLVLYIVLFLFSFFGKIGLYFVSFCFLLVDLALIIDFFIFRLYNFHINAMVINILTNPKAADSIQLGVWAFISFAGVVIFLLSLEVFLVKYLFKKDLEDLRSTNKILNKLIILPLFVIILSEKMTYGFASLFQKTDILSAFRVIPLYQPLTFNKFASKYFGVEIKKQEKNYISSSVNLQYPKKPLRSKKDLNKVNIFIIASDSINDRFVNKELTPNIENFKKDSLVFQNHYTGGNSTRFGIFSFMYGLNASYWFSFVSSQKGTVLFDYLKSIGYDVNVVSSTNTSWPEFIKTAYVNITQNVFDDFKGEPWEKDEQSSAKFLDLISKMDASKPQFAFLFMDAPHGYSYPKEFEKYEVKYKVNYLTIEKDSKDLKYLINSYKNSIMFNDMIFAKIIAKLKEKGLYENSIIIYTTDHGHEFFEYDFFGHNSSFSRAQTKIPFIMKMPGGGHKNIEKLSSHLDFVPTILSYIGLKNEPSDYANGYDLFDENFKRDSVFISNWNNNAIMTDKFTYVFSNLPNKMFKNEIRRNSDYKKVKKPKINGPLIMSIMEQNGHFYK